MITLYPRADDAGSSRAANRAILECVKHGIIKNISVMAPPYASEDAGDILKDLDKEFDVSFGLHITLNAEWDGVKWGPVSNPKDVPSLLGQDGYFPALTSHHTGRILLKEALKECKAQLEKLRSLGFRLTYLDEHMGVGLYSVPELHQALIEFAREEGLYHVDVIESLPEIDLSGDALKSLRNLLEQQPDGEYIYFTHPAFDDSELEPCYTTGVPKGKIPRERAAETRLLCDPRTKALLEEKGIRLGNFSARVTR